MVSLYSALGFDGIKRNVLQNHTCTNQHVIGAVCCPKFIELLLCHAGPCCFVNTKLRSQLFLSLNLFTDGATDFVHAPMIARPRPVGNGLSVERSFGVLKFGKQHRGGWLKNNQRKVRCKQSTKQDAPNIFDCHVLSACLGSHQHTQISKSLHSFRCLCLPSKSGELGQGTDNILPTIDCNSSL